MSRHYLVAFFVFLLLNGCALLEVPSPQKIVTNEQNSTIVSQEKTILNFAKNADEESLFMASVLAIQDEKFDEARVYLQELYAQSHKDIYLLQLVQLSMQTGQLSEAMALLNDRLVVEPHNLELKKALTTLLLSSGDYEKAKELALQIAMSVKTPQAYDLSASISIYLQDYKTAVKELKIAYEISPDETTLDKIANILFVHLGKKMKQSLCMKHISGSTDAQNLYVKGSRLHTKRPDGQMTR